MDVRVQGRPPAAGLDDRHRPALLDARGAVTGFLGVATDVTERVAAQAALKAERDIFTAGIDAGGGAHPRPRRRRHDPDVQPRVRAPDRPRGEGHARPADDGRARAARNRGDGEPGVRGDAPGDVPGLLRARMDDDPRRGTADRVVEHLPARWRRRDHAHHQHGDGHHRPAVLGGAPARLHRPPEGDPQVHHREHRREGPRRALPARQPRLGGVGGRVRRAGQHRSRTLLPEDAESRVRGDAEVLRTGDAVEYARESGEQTFMLVNFPLRDGHGAIYAIGSVATDVSESRRASRRRGRRLAHQVRVPGQHEPRDPHAAERRHRHGRAAARARRSTPSSAATLQTVRTSGDALLGVINDILDFSKIEAGKFELDEHDFDVRQIVEDTCEMVAPQAARQGRRAACLDRGRAALGLRGDGGRLRQVLTNLLSATR